MWTPVVARSPTIWPPPNAHGPRLTVLCRGGSDALNTARGEAQAKAAAAKAKGAKDAEARLAKADAEISAKLAAAEADLAKARAKAMDGIEKRDG